MKKGFNFKKAKPSIFNLHTLRDSVPENVNANVSSVIDDSNGAIQHKIAQQDVIFSNSMIEAFNKVLKYQFLYPKQINSLTKLKQILDNTIETYNLQRPQLNLKGNTPIEVFNDSPIDFSTYSDTFKAQKKYRKAQNRNPRCKLCI